MQTPLTTEQLRDLQHWPSPAIANAIETFDIRPRNTGFMNQEIACQYPELGPIVGYAATCKIRANVPGSSDPDRKETSDWWEFIESIPAPRIVVIQDLDQPPIGSMWGEVNANALGVVGVITDGGVRDLDEVRELGFQFHSKAVLVSHAYVHIVEIGQPVIVGGLTVKPGDILHADQHGVIEIPNEIATEVSLAAKTVEDREKLVIDYTRSNEFNRQDLAKKMTYLTDPQKSQT